MFVGGRAAREHRPESAALHLIHDGKAEENERPTDVNDDNGTIQPPPPFSLSSSMCVYGAFPIVNYSNRQTMTTVDDDDEHFLAFFFLLFPFFKKI